MTALSTLERRLRRSGNRLRREHAVVDSLLTAAWNRYETARIHLTRLRNRYEYEARTDPLEPIYVDPDDVEYVSGRGYADSDAVSKYKWVGTVQGGDWDESDRRFEETLVYRAYERHFDQGVSWEETAFFDHVIEEIERGRSMWGCTSREAFRERCERIDELYAEIRERGYRSQRELLNSGGVILDRSRSTRTNRLVQDEIAVDVGRDGDLLFVDGRNRLSIAKLLGVNRVPAIVMVRHERWQRLREAVARGDVPRADLPDRHRTHPDLRPID